MKTQLVAGSVAAILLVVAGCQSSENSGPTASNAERDALLTNETALANTSEGDLGPPRPTDDEVAQTRTPSDWVVLGESSANSRTALPPMNSPDMKVTTVDPIDKLFIVDASNASMYDMEAGKVALRKSESAKIRELANKIINDGSSANNEIRRIAAERNVAVPTQLDQPHQDLIARLEETEKSLFDTEFLRQQASAHRQTIAMFESQSLSGKDEAAKQFARSNLPTLQSHLREIETPFNTATEK